MPIVTLLSDWGLSDHYVAAVKGRLYSEWPEVRVVDISHLIPKFNTAAAAYVLKQAYPHFPPGTVHCIGVNDIGSPEHPHVIVYEDGHYFIGTVQSADNDIFSLIFDRKPKAWRIALPPDGTGDTFPSLNLFPLAAVHLAQGGLPDEIGEPYDWPGQSFNLRRNVSYLEYEYDMNGMKTGARINGQIVYTDSYGNGVTNITRDLFEQAAAEFPHFEIRLRSYDAHRGKKPLDRICRIYEEEAHADLCALFLDNRQLEISLNHASAAQLINLKLNSPVSIHFKI